MLKQERLRFYSIGICGRLIRGVFIRYEVQSIYYRSIYCMKQCSMWLYAWPIILILGRHESRSLYWLGNANSSALSRNTCDTIWSSIPCNYSFNGASVLNRIHNSISTEFPNDLSLQLCPIKSAFNFQHLTNTEKLNEFNENGVRSTQMLEVTERYMKKKM